MHCGSNQPVFHDLSRTDLLNKCTHGMTQNVNECLHRLIWDRCPKTSNVEQNIVALATYLAVLKFNLKKCKLFHFSFRGQVDLYPIPSRDQW